MSRIDECGIVQQLLRRAMQVAHLREQLAHVLRARARGRLVGHCGDPFDESGLEQAVHAHQHQADRAIAADEILYALAERSIDDIAG